MGLCVQLSDEKGASLALVCDEKNLLNRLLPSYDDESKPILSSIDPYGDTVFNNIQMLRFLVEWDNVAKGAVSVEEQELMDQIRKLGERVRDEVHLYLKFIGD